MHKRFEHLWIRAVGVQLYGEAKAAELFQKRRQLRLKRRLASGDADPVQRALPPRKKGFHFCNRHFRFVAPFGQHQPWIVAVGAAQVAAGQEDRAGDLARIVQQRQFLYSCNTHNDVPPPQMRQHNQYTRYCILCQ